MKSNNRHIGVSFIRGQLQLAEIEHGKKMELIALGERESSMDFGTSAVNLHADHPQLATFIYELEELMKQQKVGAKSISFAIPTDPVFVNLIPVDAHLEKADLSSHLQWELEQYYPDTPAKEFILDSHALPSESLDVQNRFMVAVQRGLVGFLQKAASELRLKLNILDIDHFSTEKTLRHNYPEVHNKIVALCGVQYGHLDASIVASGELIDYRAFPLQTQEQVKDAIAGFLKHLKEREPDHQPGALFIHGANLAKETLNELKAEARIQVLQLNALKKLPASKKLYEPFVKENSRFAAAIGLALRTS